MARPVNNPPLALAGHAPSDVSAATRRERHARHQRAPSPPACWQQSVAPSPRYLRVQLSGAHGGGRSTGALLLPPGRAVVCGEPGRTLARDERRSRRRTAWRRSLSPGESRRVRAGCRRSCGSSKASVWCHWAGCLLPHRSRRQRPRESCYGSASSKAAQSAATRRLRKGRPCEGTRRGFSARLRSAYANAGTGGAWSRGCSSSTATECAAGQRNSSPGRAV